MKVIIGVAAVGARPLLQGEEQRRAQAEVIAGVPSAGAGEVSGSPWKVVGAYRAGLSGPACSPRSEQ